MSHFPRTVSLTTLVIVSAAVITATSLTWYLATKNKKQPEKHKLVLPQHHHSKYSTKEILTHKLRSYKTFLEAITNGDIESAVQYGQQTDISNFIAIITAILAQIPFGAEWFRDELLDLFVKRCKNSNFLLQSFHFFLNAYYSEPYVGIIWSKHPIYRFIHTQNRQYSSFSNTSKRRKSRSKKPKVVDTNTTIEELIDIRRQKQRHILSQLHYSLNDDKETSVTYQGFHLSSSQRSKLQNGDKNKLMNVTQIQYDGDNILQLFEIFTFAYLDEDNKEHNDSSNDEIHQKIAINITSGFKVDIVSKENIFCDPIHGNNKLNTIQVQNVFNSNTKPLLLSLYCNQTLSSQMVFKKGDDLRKDASILTMFHLFNDIWKLNGIQYEGIAVESATYRCVPMGFDYGCIEYVSHCMPLTEIKKCAANKAGDDIFVNKLIATSVGSYIAAYIMGIRDRHSDNILIQQDGTLFHIDYGYVLGEKLSGLDASKFAITTDLQDIMGQKGWNQFVDCCVLAFLKLRNNHKDIFSFANTALRFLEWNKIEMFLKQQLMIGANKKEVEKYMKDKINKAPNKWKTRMKNYTHKIAMNVKK